MPYTKLQLAAQMQHVQLATWANSTHATQGPMLPLFFGHFDAVQMWITANGGPAAFGWDNVTGLQDAHGNQVVLAGPQGRAPFNDAWNDVRAYRASPNFNLFQAAQAWQRLIRVLSA